MRYSRIGRCTAIGCLLLPKQEINNFLGHWSALINTVCTAAGTAAAAWPLFTTVVNEHNVSSVGVHICARHYDVSSVCVYTHYFWPRAIFCKEHNSVALWCVFPLALATTCKHNCGLWILRESHKLVWICCPPPPRMSDWDVLTFGNIYECRRVLMFTLCRACSWCNS